MNSGERSDKVVRVRTQEPSDGPPGKPWRRRQFFAWLDRRITQVDPPIRDMQHLADLCGEELSHSALSNWRNNKYRPTLDKLAVLAVPLKVPKEVVWAEAGLLPEVESARRAEEQWGEMMIRSANLSDASKERLLQVHREDMRRARAEAERQLREKIELLTES